MRLSHVGPLLHRFLYGMQWKSDRRIAVDLDRRIQALVKRHGLDSTVGRQALIDTMVDQVISLRPETRRFAPDIAGLTSALVEYEIILFVPPVDFSVERSVSEYWKLKGALQSHLTFLENFPRILEALIAFTADVFGRLAAALEEPDEWSGADDSIIVITRRLDRIANLPRLAEQLVKLPFDERYEQLGLFDGLRRQLERNVVAASGGNPRNPETFNRMPRMPVKSGVDNPDELIETYFDAMPLRQVFEVEERFVIPQSIRMEHHHILAGSGHGKTQTLQALIAHDLDAVADGKRSIVVIDSQGDMIRKIANLKLFAPGGALHDRLVLIDPTDVEWPVSLNLFDVGQERLNGYAPLERERLTNSILELYDFVLGSLLGAEMTQKQNVIFRYVTRLMLHIPDATIHTLRELMEKGSEIRFAEHIAKLEGTARHFFETEFPSREFAQTRTQVLRRLWGILENQTFERMFSHPRSKLDLFSEMSAGKVILINTAKDLLKNEGAEIFGRFFIAMIAQAALERAVLPERQRMETIVYIDEAADYFDRNIGVILSQARKYKVGMVLAHQYLSQLEPKLQDAFAANTAIKFAGGFSGREARSVAAMMGCDPSLIETQPKGSFAATLRGLTPTAVPLRFPFGVLEDIETQSKAEQEALRQAMRARYAVHYSELRRPGDPAYDGGIASPSSSDASPDFRTAREPEHEPDESGTRKARRSGSSQPSDTDPDNPDTKPSSSW